VHLRRALLLFAIVLGMAALVASLSRPVEQRRSDRTATDRTEPTAPTVEPGPVTDVPPPLAFDAGDHDTRRMRAGQAATLEVSVPDAGTVAIPDMGLSAAADTVTPARFDVYASKPGRYPLTFTPAGGDADESAGTLVVTSAG